MPSYKSFCWSLGTTSFRTKEFNLKIEKQLMLLTAFRGLPQNINKDWLANSKFQEDYYNFMKTKEFIEGNAPNKSKDAREKTSGLVDIGLVDDNRYLTAVGKTLLEISTAQNFGNDNILQIANDSYIYFKQLLKTSNDVDGNIVRPYVVTAYALSKLGSLSYEEFTFLLPLAITKEKLDHIISKIILIRNASCSIDSVIIENLMSMDNYKKAYDILMSECVTEGVITEIGMNRKSHDYDKAYYPLYNALYALVFDYKDENVMTLLKVIQGIKGRSSTYWKQYLFNTSSICKIKKVKLEAVILSQPIFKVFNEKLFKSEFFKLLHLFKAKATLSDYFDLNRRYLKITDTIVFKDSSVVLDVMPKCFFSLVENDIKEIAFSNCDLLHIDCDIKQILPALNISEITLYNRLEEVYGIKIRNFYDIKTFIEKERYTRFNQMIDERFSVKTLLSLLNMFEKRQDDSIQSIVTPNADIPTIFEYIVGIIWYRISNRQGKILDYLNLSLDADLLPKTHAGGGFEDITYYYEATDDYPKHCLLIEATLSEKNTQRRMEMEPVSRHLGDFVLKHRDISAYCMFISTCLHLNVISDYRMRKNSPYYNTDGTDCICGLKIIPCQTSELKIILEKQLKYDTIFKLFEQAYQVVEAPVTWYSNQIAKKLFRGNYK